MLVLRLHGANDRLINKCGTVGAMMTGGGKTKYSEKTCPIATFSIKNTLQPKTGSNLGHCGRTLATDRLGYWALLGTHVPNKVTYKHENLIHRIKLAFLQIFKKAENKKS
jgi:hypothetical protein